MTTILYKVGRALRPYLGHPGLASLYAQGTYARAYRRGIRYENWHSPFFLFADEQQARAFLEEARRRFAPTAELAVWRGGASEVWPCPSHTYLAYKRDRWPAYWRAYARLREMGPTSTSIARATAGEYFSVVALHALASPVSPGTVLGPVFQPDECIALVRGCNSEPLAWRASPRINSTVPVGKGNRR